MKNTKRSLVASVIALMLCFSMLLGATYAWFTDFTGSNGNIIHSGELNAEMYWADELDPSVWNAVDSEQPIFNYDNWEPGYTDVKYIKIKNAGDLSFKWRLFISAVGEVTDIADVIDVYYVNPVSSALVSVDDISLTGSLSEVVEGKIYTEGIILPKDEIAQGYITEETVIAIALHMHEDAGNEYENAEFGDGFNVKLIATQFNYEQDHFGNNYDTQSQWPNNIPAGANSATAPVTPTADGKVGAAGISLESADGKISASIPEGVKLSSGATSVTLSVGKVPSSNANITLDENEASLSIDVHIEGIHAGNTVPMKIYVKELLPKGLNMGNYRFYHVENGNTVEMVLLGNSEPVHNNYEYDPATGDVVLYLKSFSEVALVADTVNAWNGNVAEAFAGGSGSEADPYIIANADQLAYMGDRISNDNANYGSAYYKLIADVNIGGSENYRENGVLFYPIGYNKIGGEIATVELDEIFFEPINPALPGDKDGDILALVGANSWYTYGGSFKGVFDGTGHTVSGIYQNTWAMKGDYNGHYYNDAMGLFGYVNGGTVKNLTVDDFYSEGEFAPTGCVTAYAGGSARFENINITNSHPQTYNTGVAGIVGWDNGNSSNFTFKNITVDESNIISALWGSWDVAASGILGCLKNGSKASFENCNVAATIDVYNDVCGNYQYYWYRYSGAYIGTVYDRLDNGNGALDLSGVTATNCTVNFGDRHEYYYCEFIENTIASYTHDYQMSRVDNADIVGEMFGAKCINHNHEEHGYETVNGTSVLVEDKQAVYIPYRQLFGGYGWGVDGVDLGEYENIVISDITNAEEKFETLFTGDFLYRVGNANAVSIGSIFKAIDGKDINNSGVYVTIDKVDPKSNVSGVFTANTSDWTKGSVKFSGTGVVKVTIQDYDFCKPTTIYLEVVDAKNITNAESATANDVVLLNDISGTFVVSNGHTFHGNGFKVTLPTSSVQNVGNGFTGYISIGASQDDGIANGGNLDNVRIEGPVYPEMYIYRDQAKITDKNDPDYGDGSNMRYFKNSVIVYGGNVNISNCYISGSRTALCLRGGNNVVIENTTLSGGSYANMQICAGSNVTLRDLTTVQVDVADSYGKGKTAHGLGIAVDSAVVDLYIEGELNQHNWLNQSQWNNIVPSVYQSQFPKFFTESTFNEYWHYLNGGSEPYVNLAFIYACNWDIKKIHDNRTTVDYGTQSATIAGVAGGVYSKLNTVGGNAITDSDLVAPEYISDGFNPVAPKLDFDNTPNYDADDANDANDTYCVYNESTGTLKIGLSGASKTLDLSKISVMKNGIPLAYSVYLNGTQIGGTSVTINAADGAKQTLTFKATSNDAGYDKNGKPIEGSIEYTWTVTIDVATLSFPAPEWNMGGNYKFDATTNCIFVEYNSDYGEAVPIYEGIKVIYYDKNGKKIEKDFSGISAVPTGSNNANANAFVYTLSDGSTLTMKFSSGWKSGATTHQFATYNKNGNKVYIYPQSLDNSNYARNETTAQDFDVKISYTFTDPNGQSISQTMQWYNVKDNNGKVTTVQWKTFDATNGKKNPTICLTPDTLITLADGTQKEIQNVRVGEMVLAWNFNTGKYDAVPVSLLQTHGTGVQKVLHLYFEDGTELKVLGEHGIFDADINTFIFIDKDDVEEYIGHGFVKQNGDSFEIVKLVGYEVTEEFTTAYTILSTEHYNVLAEGMFTVTPAHVGDNFFTPFDIGEDMTYDDEAVKADIEKYGLYTYADFDHVLTYEQFVALNLGQFKVSVGKGYVTYEGLIYLIENFINNEDFNV